MECSELQGKVSAFVEAYGLDAPLHARLLDLVSEVGELSKEALMASDYGSEEHEFDEKWGAEFGDVLFSLLCVAAKTGVDFEEELLQVLTKYEERLAAFADAGSGDSDDEDE